MVLALLFDIDGTLLHTLDAIVDSMNAAFQEFGVRPLTAAEIRPMIGMPVARQMDQLRGMRGPVVERIAVRYYEVFMRLVVDGLPLFPGVRDTLPGLNRPVCSLTSRRRFGARRMLEVAGLASYFDAIVGGDEVDRPKPYPDLPRFSARALGVSPKSCVVVGDSPVDVLAGRSAGMWTVAAMYGYGDPAAIRQSKPHAVLERFAELPRVLAELEGEALSG